jgi:hypothetical protein
MLAISVDAAAFIIRSLLRSACPVSPQPGNPSLAAIRKTHFLAQLYGAADAAWMERLSSDCTFVPDADGNGCVLRTQESSWGENFCVSELRRHMLKMELAFRPKQLWDESRKHHLIRPHQHPVIRTQQQGKVLHVRLDSHQRPCCAAYAGINTRTGQSIFESTHVWQRQEHKQRPLEPAFRSARSRSRFGSPSSLVLRKSGTRN